MDCFVATLLAMTERERVRNDWKGGGEKGWALFFWIASSLRFSQ